MIKLLSEQKTSLPLITGGNIFTYNPYKETKKLCKVTDVATCRGKCRITIAGYIDDGLKADSGWLDWCLEGCYERYVLDSKSDECRMSTVCLSEKTCYISMSEAPNPEKIKEYHL